MNATILITGAGVLLTGLVTYLVAARRMSGKIATSDASDLWAESTAIRTDYRTRITELNGVVRILEQRLDRVEELNTVLVRENNQLVEKVVALEKLVTTLRETISRLEDVIDVQRRELGQ